MKFALILLSLVTLVMPAMGSDEGFLYINYSPDIRYSANKIDVRIALLPEKGLFGYGHDMGRIKPCVPNASDCLSFDFMAVASLPSGEIKGQILERGEFSFEVQELVQFTLFGVEEPAYRVAVRKSGELANFYYLSPNRGVIAIGVLNFGNDNIPESLFFLKSSQGIFHAPIQTLPSN